MAKELLKHASILHNGELKVIYISKSFFQIVGFIQSFPPPEVDHVAKHAKFFLLFCPTFKHYLALHINPKSHTMKAFGEQASLHKITNNK